MTARDMTTPATRWSIRCATSEDIECLVPLFDAYRRFYGQVADPDLARGFLAERLARAESHTLLATGQAGRVALPLGFAQLYPMFSSIRCQRTLVLNDLYVAAASRGLGVGAALLGHARHLAVQLGAASISLQTAADNRQAQSLYERFGFVRDDAFFDYVLTLS